MQLYDHSVQRENCGFGLIAHQHGETSHKLIKTAISALDRMQHRGGIAADGKTGDGCGLLLQKPDSFFRAVAEDNGWKLGKKYAVGMIFLSPDPVAAALSKKILEEEFSDESLTLVGWRTVPTDTSVLGKAAINNMPAIEQVFIDAPPGWRNRDLERRLFMARRRAEKRITDDVFYVASLSCLVTIYKGLMMPIDLPNFYLDLADIRMKSAICVFHQRFSTNTSPQWYLAQPFRYLAHNGEINTIKGNRQWSRARSYRFKSPLLPDLKDAAPFVGQAGSDSSSLDNMLELFLAGGMDLYRAMRLLMPPAWQNSTLMDDELRAFYEFNSMHMEPWDGPAGVVMTNGRHVACNLDRNGLRPARYVITRNGFITLASEVGIWDYGEDEVIEKGRVGPGEMLALDTYTGKLFNSNDIDNELKGRHPYREWLDQHVRHLVPFDQCEANQIGVRIFSDQEMNQYHKMFNYSYEEIHQVIKTLAENGQEATGSMGDDTPMAVLSSKPRVLYDYFRQQFAQVTNPPIDPLRERFVMSLGTCIGREHNVFNETSGHADRMLFTTPILMYTGLKQLRALDPEHYRSDTLSLTYHKDEGLEAAIVRLCNEAEELVKNKSTVILILSDRNISKELLVIPAAMAVGAVQMRLVDQQLRCDSNIIVETASVRDSHQYAVLLGLGATAIYPYLAFETIEQLVEQGQIKLSARDAIVNYREGINKGLLKILSKMGISTIASYRCAGLFEVIGLNENIMKLCFSELPSRIQGADFSDIEQDNINLARKAFLPHQKMSHGGLLKYVHGEEYHAFNPDVVNYLQRAVLNGNYDDYRKFADEVNNRPAAMLRDLLIFKNDCEAIDISEVESSNEMFKRFDSAAMSIGALSPEAHEALAIAMNRLGGSSNSGEGGEDERRFGTVKNSRIKQIASGRFGVTPHYLVNADVLQIKVAQGAKPGEGGQLPGDKVSPLIAKLRYSVPGVTLISPPPHHDIYSIEDLAQLIFDLKQVNPKAVISVKLVSGPGVGTIAAGVAKAYADFITISGYDGGTAASPLTSVKYAGCPWELGLAEAHQALVTNGLRHKVRLQVDGGLKTGVDIVKAAILGAESFGFGTAPMVALGCKFLRICHLNNCATGVATQDEVLREQFFKGLPEQAMNYFKFIAQDVREILASLGVASLTDIIGRVDLLTQIDGISAKQQKLDLSPIIAPVIAADNTALHQTEGNKPFDEGLLNQKMLEAAKDAVAHSHGGEFRFTIQNTDRSVGATLSGEIARQHGDQGMASAPITIHLSGTAGQSFGVWNAGGLNLTLTGDANDYVGKGMTGGVLIVKPPKGVDYLSHKTMIMGNTCLYGATGGKLYASGRAGERFAVRNSGCRAVVEGAGDHACEYMTGGIVTILGDVGVNFGAGMTGGFAYVLDEKSDLDIRLNTESIEMLAVDDLAIHREHLRGIITHHFEETGSLRAQDILQNFDQFAPLFKLIKPTATDVKTLLGHRSRSTAELRVQAQ
ncbi:glutamate synthase large subunit [Colwellia sp. 4_MG-2023]|jgi:glutamate synthase (NADPH/NADH) large chain|uniref:glutamate synthase large subunit n=1 Tax=unclassified Colwellia TaxID=196834 RepID=UPI001C088F3B|nr:MULTISPECIES: glutamate synthase large subunit [unclassified Colwellia]MBU2924093.1 glutamate synthase large subunit [Colwellia sp. C2M11]MDO6486796.1 glutamate synthase large subunit [Colwellia sp. 6_MG-2023]MDO6506127.1 glutamate synthase large subunit [Colwellia sp. 5_MG-2023]MDO6554813.1 glutamate synthase large subunit [Colwellia sp. 4_MG-2023]MDO6651984.1 glutamate synthase large subunit [Colwellia sp. 3_MG-2023]